MKKLALSLILPLLVSCAEEKPSCDEVWDKAQSTVYKRHYQLKGSAGGVTCPLSFSDKDTDPTTGSCTVESSRDIDGEDLCVTEAVLLCKDLEGNYTKNAINLSATREEKSTLTGELIVYLGSGMYCAYTITYTPL